MSEPKAVAQQHTPDLSKIPDSLKALDWKPWTEDAMAYDGDEILCAVPVVNGRGGWYYEISVLVVKCDEGYFELECEGDAWGWGPEEIDFYVLIRR